jgi:DnaJ like chaperone protein
MLETLVLVHALPDERREEPPHAAASPRAVAGEHPEFAPRRCADAVARAPQWRKLRAPIEAQETMQRPPWLGKLIGGALGLIVFDIPGLLLGLLIGHIVDSVYRVKTFVGGTLQTVRDAFFETTFTLMGRLAKSDGRISEQEIAVTEQLMVRMGLGAAHRRDAIALFKRGAGPEFDVDEQLTRFMTQCGAHPILRQMLVMFLFSMAAADGTMAVPEHELLRRIANRIGFSDASFEQLLRMFSAQEHFHSAPGAAPAACTLADAYAALGVAETAASADVKRAYRRLMSQYHPDKLIAEGMPEDMVKMSTERTQEIQNAWEQIREARGL